VLKISPTFELPDDAVTETFAILAKRGMGKTYAASVLVEELLGRDLPVVVLDPVGAWWGLRASADGKPDGGCPVTILGGDRGDLPLEPRSGAAIAELVARERAPLVLDLSLMSKADMARFVEAFAETLYRRNRHPLHVVLDEADAFAPQRPAPGEQRMLGAMNSLVRRGRQRGLGCTLITQRPAVISKDVLTQVEVLVCFRLTHPRDRKALMEWVDQHADDAQRAEFTASLASLPKGTCWVWSPGWLETFERVKIRARRTFDSSATPKAGQKLKRPPLRAMDLDPLRKAMGKAADDAEANDPRKLRAKLVAAERELAKLRSAPTAPPAADLEELHRARAELAELRPRAAEAANLQRTLRRAVAVLEGVVNETKGALQDDGEPLPGVVLAESSFGRERMRPAAPPAAPKPSRPTNGDASLNGPQQRILGALTWWVAFGVTQPSRAQVAFIAGYSPNGGAYLNQLGSLRTLGLIDYPVPNQVALTDAGRAAAPCTSAPATVDELHRRILEKLNGPQRRIVEAVLAAPDGITREQLADAAGYAAGGGAYLNQLGSLRTLGLIDYPERGVVAPTPVLLPS